MAAPMGGGGAFWRVPAFPLDLNHEKQKNQRRTNLETTRRPSRSPAAPVHHGPRHLFSPPAAQPLGREAAAAIFDSLARPWCSPLHQRRPLGPAPSYRPWRFAPGRTQQSRSRGRSAAVRRDSCHPPAQHRPRRHVRRPSSAPPPPRSPRAGQTPSRLPRLPPSPPPAKAARHFTPQTLSRPDAAPCAFQMCGFNVKRRTGLPVKRLIERKSACGYANKATAVPTSLDFLMQLHLFNSPRPKVHQNYDRTISETKLYPLEASPRFVA